MAKLFNFATAIYIQRTDMTQQGFEDYVFAVYDSKNGTAKSYITAIHIIDDMFAMDDVFALNGKSITYIEDSDLLKRVADFVYSQQKLFIKGEDSIFRNINPGQVSYPGKRFCSAAINQLLAYHKYDIKEKEADGIVKGLNTGTKVSTALSTLFKLDKEGSNKIITTTTRLGQSYFRKMVLTNYENKCCVTGLNIPHTLIASHIVAWKDDKRYRMDPENGLCLSATYDAAFDKHLISFDEDYRMIVSKEIKDYYTNDVTKEYFEKFEGKRMILPKLFLPSQKLLEKHRSLLVV